LILCNGEWKYYLRIARQDHWIKNIFVIPGLIFVVLMIPALNCSWKEILFHFLFDMAAVCLIASANYTINEWLDAPFDKYHLVKRFRPCVSDR
jgi:decaprenyl-phosphate phosphoribosyltransferase